MANRSHGLSEAFHTYLMQETLRESPLQARLREETAVRPDAGWQIAPEQGQFLALLVRLIGARRIVEVGTYTGYSSLAMALAMPKGGHMDCFDISEEVTSVAKRYWAEAGLESGIQLHLGPATENLAQFLAGGAREQIDLVFIDADKESYPAYFDLGLELLRPGGLMAFDNAFMGGAIADPDNQSPGVVAMRELNRRAFSDGRVESAMLPIADGLTLCRKVAPAD